MSISPKILPSVLNAKSLDLILFLSVIVFPSWSTIGAAPTHANIVPAGNIPVDTGRTPMPKGELIPVISFSSTIVSVPLLFTLSLLIYPSFSVHEKPAPLSPISAEFEIKTNFPSWLKIAPSGLSKFFNTCLTTAGVECTPA